MLFFVIPKFCKSIFFQFLLGVKMAPRETEVNAYAKLRVDKERAYRKIPKISPGAYIFQEPFLRGFFFGGACVRMEICVSKSIRLACRGKEIYHFCFVLLCIRGQIPSTSPPGGLYSEGRFNGGFFALRL